MATKKTKTKKSPTGAPLGNPLKFFREGAEKIKAMYKKGGYNTPNQNSLPKKFMGGPDDTTNPSTSQSPSSTVSTQTTPYETKKQKILGIIPTGNTVQTRYGDERVWKGDKFNQTNFKETQVLDKEGQIKKSNKTPVTNQPLYNKKIEPSINANTMQTTEGTTPYFNKKGGSAKRKKK